MRLNLCSDRLSNRLLHLVKLNEQSERQAGLQAGLPPVLQLLLPDRLSGGILGGAGA